MKDHIPVWAGSYENPSALHGLERLARIIADHVATGGFAHEEAEVGGFVTVRQARQILAAPAPRREEKE